MKKTEREIFFEKLLEHYYGTILVLDKTGKVVYFNTNVLINTKDLSREKLMNSTIYELVEEGYYSPSPSLEVLQTKQPVTMQLAGRLNLPLMTTSIPILDDAGELEYVVAFSQDMAFVNEVIKKVDIEKLKTKQIMKYAIEARQSNEYVAESKAIKQVFRYLDNIAKSDSTIMLYGESGTGKEVMAKYAYMNSARRNEIYLPINCAAFPPELIESELFGYERGAFTGADRDGKIGLFELADNGTLFLDEIGELSLPLQSKLLRVLESGEIKRIGSSKIKRVNVRIIAATNRDLADMVQKKQFREDLYYRLNVIPVTIPPIRDRKEDILPLCYSFLNEFTQKYGQSKVFSMDTIEWFQTYDWPGNVREIRNVVERLFITTASDIISINNQGTFYTLSKADAGPAGEAVPANDPLIFSKTYKDALSEFERTYISRVMERCGGKIVKAAAEMGISRSDLYYKLKKLRE